MKNKKFGWVRDELDRRDLPFVRPKLVEYKSVKLSDNYILPPIVDQGNLGSCTANGVGTVVGFNLLNKHSQGGTPWFQPSRLFIYYEERQLEHTIKWDSGAQIRDGIKVVANEGVPDEKIWPYIISQFAKKPPQIAYKSALNYQSLEYRSVDNTDKGAILQALYEGYPVVFGFIVYESFDTSDVAKTGIIPLPKPGENKLGGHCMVVDSYDVTSDRFGGPNSWGTKWGDNGRFTIPAAYLTDPNLADDFWVINLME